MFDTNFLYDDKEGNEKSVEAIEEDEGVGKEDEDDGFLDQGPNEQ